MDRTIKKRAKVLSILMGKSMTEYISDLMRDDLEKNKGRIDDAIAGNNANLLDLIVKTKTRR